MWTATGTYRLDSDSRIFFDAVILRLIQRNSRVLGRYGRRGIVEGEICDAELRGIWRDAQRHGWIKLRFDPIDGRFNGEYGLDTDGTPAIGRCSGLLQRRDR